MMEALNGCPNCGSDFDVVNNFCEQCGYDLRPHQITLPCCGGTIIPKAYGPNKFCLFCGSPREDTDQELLVNEV